MSYSVTATGWPATGTPTGNVTVAVSGGSESCRGSVAAGSRSLTPTIVGSRTLTATYTGDAIFTGSTSAGEPHTVTPAPNPGGGDGGGGGGSDVGSPPAVSGALGEGRAHLAVVRPAASGLA